MSSHRPTTLERAYELARGGGCRTVGEIKQALQAEGFERIQDSLYGPTLPGRVGAYGRGQVHLCATGPNAGSGDRHKPCFDGLDAERVATQLQALLLAEDGV